MVQIANTKDIDKPSTMNFKIWKCLGAQARYALQSFCGVILLFCNNKEAKRISISIVGAGSQWYFIIFHQATTKVIYK